jgi:hypothetical protein
VSGYPAAPWELRGRVALIPAAVPAAAAHAAGVPPGARLLTANGRTLGGLMLADYDATATLRYRELIVFSGLALLGTRPAFVVSHIYVDSEASRQGGRAIWGLPKELARFDVRSGRVDIRHDDGRALASIALRTRRRSAPIPLIAPVLGTLDGAAARTVAAGRMRAALGSAAVDVAPESPFAALRVGGRAPALIGTGLDLPFPAPA